MVVMVRSGCSGHGVPGFVLNRPGYSWLINSGLS